MIEETRLRMLENRWRDILSDKLAVESRREEIDANRRKHTFIFIAVTAGFSLFKGNIPNIRALVILVSTLVVTFMGGVGTTMYSVYEKCMEADDMLMYADRERAALGVELGELREAVQNMAQPDERSRSQDVKRRIAVLEQAVEREFSSTLDRTSFWVHCLEYLGFLVGMIYILCVSCTASVD